MKNFKEFKSKIEFVLTDIDDTLTSEGQLHANAYESLWKLSNAGLKIIPITGRPAGWCEMIARLWPVAGIVGENGGFYFQYSNKKMHRWFFTDEATIQKNRIQLNKIQSAVLKTVPGSALASDQFCRLMDLAIDFCEDVPKLPDAEIQKIVNQFTEAGAQAKVSSIHVNGWFGEYDKLSTTTTFLKNEFHLTDQSILEKCIFVGDSPNDEPMFKYFPFSFGVANIQDFKLTLKNLPTFVANKKGGDGFTEIANHILNIIK